MTALGERIKALRAERELQQRQLAEKAELTPSMVSQIESGRRHALAHTLGKIAAALGVPIAALFDGQAGGQHRRRPASGLSGRVVRRLLRAVGGARGGSLQGKIRAVVSTLGPEVRGVTTEKVVIKPGR